MDLKQKVHRKTVVLFLNDTLQLILINKNKMRQPYWRKCNPTVSLRAVKVAETCYCLLDFKFQTLGRCVGVTLGGSLLCVLGWNLSISKSQLSLDSEWRLELLCQTIRRCPVHCLTFKCFCTGLNVWLSVTREQVTPKKTTPTLPPTPRVVQNWNSSHSKVMHTLSAIDRITSESLIAVGNNFDEQYVPSQTTVV